MTKQEMNEKVNRLRALRKITDDLQADKRAAYEVASYHAVDRIQAKMDAAWAEWVKIDRELSSDANDRLAAHLTENPDEGVQS